MHTQSTKTQTGDKDIDVKCPIGPLVILKDPTKKTHKKSVFWCSSQTVFGVSDAPALPSNISCVYKVQTNNSRAVLCTWDRGRDTFLTTNSSLWWVCQTPAHPTLAGATSLTQFAHMCFRVRTPSGQHTPGPVTYAVSRNGADFLSASLALSGSVQQVSVWVESHNLLGSAESVPINYTLRDIGETVDTGALFPLSAFQVCDV